MTIKEQLNSNIPESAVSIRNQGGKTLSYLEGWYVIDRLNQILGTENWSHEIISLVGVPGTTVPAYICHVRLQTNIDGKISIKDGVGYGADRDATNPGEMAAKGAEMDGLKRAAIKLGRSLGLALYDKEQQYVSKAPEAAPEAVAAPVPVGNPSPSQGTEQKLEPAKSSQNKKAKGLEPVAKDLIKAAFGVLKARGETDSQTFSAKYLNGGKLAELDDETAVTVYQQLTVDFPQLTAN